jgi:hypothetical protein
VGQNRIARFSDGKQRGTESWGNAMNSDLSSAPADASAAFINQDLGSGLVYQGDVSSAIDDVRRLADVVWPHAVRAMATLRLADLIASGLTRVEDLAAAVDADGDGLRRLLVYLASRHVLRKTADGEFLLAPAGRLLMDGHPSHMRKVLDQEALASRVNLSAGALLESVRTGRAAYPSVFGRSFYEDVGADPVLFADFDNYARIYTGRTVGAVLTYDWKQTDSVVDVGGGSGMLLARLLTAEPHLRGTLFDLPGTVTRAEETFARACVADRVQVAAGSFFDPLPRGGDVYLLSGVLIDWPDEQATAILRRCGEAAGRSGRVLIAEQRSVAESAAADENLRILFLVGGRARTVEQFRVLARNAGLKIVSAPPEPAAISLVECVPLEN